MKRGELFPSKYLKADDIDNEADGQAMVTIKTVKFETLKDNEGNEDEKPILYFNNFPKGLVLNKTNGDRLFDEWDDTDSWRGKSIVLYTEPVTAFGKTAPAIRLRIPKNKTAPASRSVESDEPPLSEPQDSLMP